MTKDPYEILGVPKNITEEKLKKVYKALAKKYHPDVDSSPEAEAKFKEVSDAYQTILSNRYVEPQHPYAKYIKKLKYHITGLGENGSNTKYNVHYIFITNVIKQIESSKNEKAAQMLFQSGMEMIYDIFKETITNYCLPLGISFDDAMMEIDGNCSYAELIERLEDLKENKLNQNKRAA